MSKAKETWRHRRSWRPDRQPYGWDDLPGSAPAPERTVHDGLLTTVEYLEPNGYFAVRAVTWKPDHPRDRMAIAVFRDPGTQPWEIGLGVAYALHDQYQLSNALLSARVA